MEPKTNKQLMQRSVLRMVVGVLEERPSLLGQFAFLDDMIPSALDPGDAGYAPRRHQEQLAWLKAVVSD